MFVHELGHYLAARSVGVKVEKFYIGFNIFGYGFKKTINGTEYGIGWKYNSGGVGVGTTSGDNTKMWIPQIGYGTTI